MIHITRRTLPAILLLLLVSSPLTAAARTWTGTVSDRWSNPANWDGGVPVAGDDLLFPSLPNGPSISTNDLAFGTMFHSITVNGPSYRIGGNGIVLGAGGLTLNAPFLVSLIHGEVRFSSITLADSQSWGGQGSELTRIGPTNINGKTLTITNSVRLDLDSITGTGAIVENAPNSFVRSESSAYLGTVAVNAGPFSVGGSAGDLQVTGAGAGGDEEVNGANASLELGGPNIANVMVSGSGALTLHGNSGTSYAAGSLAFMPATGDAAWFVVADGNIPVVFNVTGRVALGNALLVLRSGQSTPFTLIHNQGVDPIAGTFLGLPEGAIFGNGVWFRISYSGGGGHDVTLAPVSTAVTGTSTSITSSANPASTGDSVTFTASVTSPSGTPAGVVSFYDGGILLGSSALDASGRAALTTSLAAAGSHVVTAAYLGSDGVATSQGTLRQAACEPPTITQQPASQAILAGQPVTLTVQAGPAPPFSFQWYRGVAGDVSSPIAGATSQTLAPFVPVENLSFWVQASNACGSVQSATATITVRQPRRRIVGH